MGKKENIIDLATTIAFGGIILYSLGWLYWWNYFATFNIDLTFIDVPFEKVIATTWPFVLFSCSGGMIIVIYLSEIKTKKHYLLYVSILYVIMAFIPIYAILENESWVLYSCLILILINVILIVIQLKLEKKPKLIFISKRNLTYSSIVVLYLVSLVVYFHIGVKDAKNKIRFFSPNIEIKLKNDSSIIEGDFIAHMKNKYFILSEIDSTKHEVLIFDEGNVERVKLK